MTFAKSISTCFRKYATFSGRATRSEFWWWYLFNLVITAATLCLGFAVAMIFEIKDIAGLVTAVYVPPILAFLALLLPTLAVYTRRLHDAGWSGWWALISFFICGTTGNIFVMIFGLIPSDPNENKYGAPEK